MSTSELGQILPADDVVIGIREPLVDVDSVRPEVIGIGIPSPQPLFDDAPGALSWDSLSEITHFTVVEGCSCAACQSLLAAGGGKDGGKGDATDAATTDGSPTGANPVGQNIGVLLPLGTNPDGSRFFSGNRNIDATLIGSKWGTLNLTYSFPTSGTNYNGSGYDSNGVSLYHIDLGAQQQAAARASFAQLAAATGLTFTEITDTDTVHANIRISQTADQDDQSAYGNFPSDTKGLAGDIWFGRTSQPYYDLAFKGTWGYATMMHEIGHTMGLKHGHQDYTNSDLSFYFGTAPRFGSQSLTADRDGQAWSLMTYTPAPGYANLFAGEKINQPQTYMQYDLAALQYMYGANYATNAGDSTYTFSQTTGEMFINGVGQGAPSGNKIFLTIWDGGGNDTIDASNYTTGVTVDLRPGEFSTVDQAQLANNLAYQNLTVLAPGNIAMSLLYNNDARSLIENVKGGVGNDVFIGNSANNVLDGGAGSDTVIFTGQTGITATLNDTGADVVVTHDGETDTLRNIENIQGTVGNDTLIGNAQNNTFSGGVGGADTLSGLGGDDRLIGGGFTVTSTNSAPSQPDITKPASTSNGSMATAVATAGFFDVDANPNITNSTSIPHATINATAAGGIYEFYRIDVTVAGSTGIFDIDGTGTLDDSILEVLNAAGTVIANNDTGPGDPGTTTGDDAYVTYTFATAGTYYIRVSRYVTGVVAQPPLAGQTYQLNISLQNAAVVTTTVTANSTSSLVADGGEGNDFVQGTIANDTLTGGNGTDTVSFATAFSTTAAGVTFSLAQQGTAQNTGAAGTDTVTGFENVIGSQYNDTLTGDAGNNTIEGGLGNDTLTGGFGNDTASYAGATAGVTVSLGLLGQAQNTVAAGTDTLAGIENLLGSAFNDTLTGNTAENILSGGAGDDTLNPGQTAAGQQDLLDGGEGADTASFAGTLVPVTATLNGSADGIASIAGAQIATLRNIENLTGGSGNDILTGDANANAIEGGLGDDTLDGGAGIDTLTFTGATAVTLNLATLTAQATGFGNDTIVNFENVRTGSGADTITGDAGDNVFFDGGGADIYNGAAGSDTVDYTNITAALTVNLNLATAQAAATGGDTLSGIENVTGSLTGANTLQGGNSTANRLVGGAAADFLVGNGLDDTLIGGAGNDVIFGDYVNTYIITPGVADGNDVLEGGAGSDSLVGGAGNDILRGGDGDDVLVGGIANGISAGLTAVYTNDGGDDTYDGGDGTDIAYAYYTDHTGGIVFDLGNLAGNSSITVGGVASGSFTSVERVIFRGGTGNDVVRGGGTLDTLVGNAGDDVLDGWYGNDTLSGGLGSDTLIGGEGLDTATYANATAGVTVDLRIEGVAQDTVGEGIDTLSGIEYLTGSGYGDTLRGNDDFNLIVDNAVAVTTTALAQTDSLFGYGGNDSILVTRANITNAATSTASSNVNMDGGDGDDFIELRAGTLSTGLTTNVAGLAAQTYAALGATSNDRNIDVVTVQGGAGNDRIILTGVASATVDAGSGADIVSISMRGVAGVNNYQLTLGTGADIIQLGVGTNAATSTEVATTARTNRVTDFERGDAADRFELSNFLNFGLTGYTANSNAFASGHLRLVQSGSDLLVQTDRDGTGTANGFVTVFAISNGYTGGFTAFNFDGFIGALTLTGIGALDETIIGATGNDVLNGMDGNDTLIGLAGNDTLIGMAGNDTLDGGIGDDLLRGGAGDDILIGGAGSDTASYEDATAGVTVSLAIAGAQVTGDGSDTLSGIENLVGSAFNDVLTGDAGVNRINGGAGNDTIDGGAGADTLTGGIGNDGYVVDDAGDVVVELLGEGTDAVSASVNYTLTDNVENLVLTGGARKGTGNALANVITGNGLSNVLTGGGGDDVLDGDTGADSLVGNSGNDTYVVDNVGDVVTEVAGEGTDTVRASINYVLGDNVENIILTGAARKGTGNALANVITGNGLSNVLDGGAGADTLLGGAGDDSYVVDNAGDVVTEVGGEGNDTVRASINYTLAANVENLILTDAARKGNGNDLANVITGNALSNVLTGGGGDDVLDGGTGADNLAGNAGNDLYMVDDAGDVVTELGGEGTDTVMASITYMLGDNVENLVLTGTARKGTGNDLANIISGNDVANLLYGGGGNDTLRGLDGIDRFTGGTGADRFVMDVNSTEVTTNRGSLSIDMILDFNAAQGDKIDLSNIDFNGTAAGNGTFNFVGSGNGQNAGDVSFTSYASVGAAEAALGYDIDGIDGPGASGPVSIIFGHTDNDSVADFAVVLFNTSTVNLADFTPPPTVI